MEERFYPDEGFKEIVKEFGAVLTAIDGHMRWVVTKDNGEQYALRPYSARDTTGEQFASDI